MFEYPAPPPWRCIEFVSDLHLDGHTPRTTERFLRYLQRTSADAVFLLGDIFEVWIGPEAIDEPGAVAEIADALRTASRRLTLAFMAGNRDFLLDAGTCARLGLTALPDPTCLRAWDGAVVLSHGDAWCLDDRDYQRFRAEVRSETWQSRFMAQPYAQRQQVASDIRARSEARKQALGPQAYGDVDWTTAAAHLRAARATHLIHGHTHRPGDDARRDDDGGGDAERLLWRHVLSDWDCESVGHERAQVLRWAATTGLSRHVVNEDGSLSPIGSMASASDLAATRP